MCIYHREINRQKLKIDAKTRTTSIYIYICIRRQTLTIVLTVTHACGRSNLCATQTHHGKGYDMLRVVSNSWTIYIYVKVGIQRGISIVGSAKLRIRIRCSNTDRTVKIHP